MSLRDTEPADIDPGDADYGRDPYPALNAARERHPLGRTPSGWEVLRYDDVLGLLRDDRLRPAGLHTLHNQGIVSGPLHDWWQLLMFHHEPPEHTRLRSLVARALTSRRVEAFRPQLARISDRVVRAALDRERVDLVEHFADTIPITAICDLLGIPAEAHADFGAWTVTVGLGFSPVLSPETLHAVETALTTLNAQVAYLIAQRRRQPRDDLLQGLIDAEQEGDRLSEEELIALVVDLLFSGHDTSKSLLSIGCWLLASRPGDVSRLQAEPHLVRPFVEEVLRYQSPILSTPREVLQDLRVGGVDIGAGSIVGLSLAAGNRDPRQFTDPDRFDLARRDNRPLSFGQGVHFCVGAAFARAEAQEAFRSLTTHVAAMTPVTDGPSWAPLEGIRRLTDVQVELSAGGGHAGSA